MKQQFTEISSQRDLEKEFIHISKIFVGKETESNWEERDALVKKLRCYLKCTNLEEYKEDIVRGLHDAMSSLIKSIHSLRTSVALEGLSLVSDISFIIGNGLDQYTMETILSNLLKSSSVTKKLIVTKTAEVTRIFLSNTNFYTKMLVMLCKTIHEKNVQLRQLASTYIKVLLETHGSKENVRFTIEKADALVLLDIFLKKGLVDAAPAIRDSCRSLYWTFHQLWSLQAEKLCKSLDIATQRQIEKSKFITDNHRPLNSRSNSLSSLNTKSPFTSTTVTPPLSRTSSSSSIDINNNNKQQQAIFKKPVLKRSNNIPATSSEVRRNINVQKMSRISNISNVSAPSTINIQHKLNVTNITRRTQSEFHQQSVLASASLLHMLKSNDVHMKCKGLKLLSDRLKKTRYKSNPFDIILPPDVPTKIDLLPILMDTISKMDLQLEIYQTLMSWESLAGIFVYIMSVNYYCPTLIVLSQAATRNEMKEMYKKGLTRIKMFLKRNDIELSQHLLNLLKSTMSDQKLLDATIKRDLQLFPVYKQYLQNGILIWMDEIVCDYIGIPEDEDKELLMEGSHWLHVTNDTMLSSQWFDINVNIQSYIEYILCTLLETQKTSDMYSTLCQLAGHLKMANQRVFDNELKKIGNDSSKLIEKALGLTLTFDDGFSIENVSTTGIEDITCSELPADIMEESNNNNDSGLTQEISIIAIKPNDIIEPISLVKEKESFKLPTTIIPLVKEKEASLKRPNTIPKRISLDVDLNIPRRKRRKESNEPSNNELVMNFITTKNETMLPKIQELSMSMPTHQGYNTHFWSPLFSLLDTVSYCLVHSGDSIRSHAVILINTLLDNQKELFQFHDSQHYHTLYHLSKALILTNVDVYDSISSTAEKAIETIFTRACSTEIALKTLWDLSRDDEFLNPQKNFSAHPLGTLFMYISKLAPKATFLSLETFLKNGAADTLVKGHNHINVSVRKSCLQATLGIHKVLGEEYITKYLSLLRTDQVKLLRLYLPKKK